MKILHHALLALWAGGLPLVASAQAPALATFTVGPTTVTAAAVATNLEVVWELVWGPDNFIWMTERYGRISRVNPATGQVLPLLTLPDVTPVGESGLLGMALHPQFAASPFVYVVYNYTDAGTLKEKLVRYTTRPPRARLARRWCCWATLRPPPRTAVRACSSCPTSRCS